MSLFLYFLKIFTFFIRLYNIKHFRMLELSSLPKCPVYSPKKSSKSDIQLDNAFVLVLKQVRILRAFPVVVRPLYIILETKYMQNNVEMRNGNVVFAFN